MKSCICLHVCAKFVSVCDSVYAWFQEVVSPLDDAFTLFYGKYRTNAPRIKSLMKQVEQRVDKSPEYVISMLVVMSVWYLCGICFR